MTIAEAIKILTHMGGPDFRGHTEDILAARKLGIEALKFFQEFQKVTGSHQDARLPGETKELNQIFTQGIILRLGINERVAP